MVGGTGLYIRTLTGGIAEMPPADYELRKRLRDQEEREGAGSLFKKLCELDLDAAEHIPPQNLPRIVRSLEVITLTGRKHSEIRREHSFADRPYNRLYLCLSPDRSVLYERIDKRVDNMIKGGLLEEVNALYKRGYARELKSMQSLGYRHATMALSGESSLDEAVNLMKRDTRRYAKRQFTWFRSEPEVLQTTPEQIDGIGLVVANFLGC